MRRGFSHWRSLFFFRHCSAQFFPTHQNHASGQKVCVGFLHATPRAAVHTAPPARTSQGTAATRTFSKSDDGTLTANFQERTEKNYKTRNFFEGESTNTQTAGNSHLMTLVQLENACRHLMKKGRPADCGVSLKNLYRLPASSLVYEKAQNFTDCILPCWWHAFGHYLELQTVDQATEKFFPCAQLAVVLNSLAKIDKATEGKIVERLGWPCLQKLTDAIFDDATVLPYRSLAMVMKSVRTLLPPRQRDVDIGAQVKPTLLPWSTAKLNRFMPKFFDSLHHYDPQTDPKSYLNIEEAVLFAYFVADLGMKSPCDKNMPNNEKACAALAKVCVKFSSPNFFCESPLARLIQLVKFTQLCVDWQFDVESYCPGGKAHATVWSNVFTQMAALLARTANPPDNKISKVRLRATACKLCLIAACKFGRERQFALNMRSVWYDTFGPNSMSSHQVSLLVENVRQSVNCRRQAEKYGDHGCLKKLFEIMLHE